MKRNHGLVMGFFTLLLISSGVSAIELFPTVIYGDDDRLDLYAVQNPALLKLADSTVSLFRASDVNIDPATGMAELSTETFGESDNLCKEEPFYDQPTGAFCSGSLVAPDLIMTAGHCVTSQSSCNLIKFVFGFGIKAEGQYPTEVAPTEVYGCAQLVVTKQERAGADYALIKLDRPVTQHEHLPINRTGSIENGSSLIVIGHPSGLPTKIAGGAHVRDNSPMGYFVANLDTYGGNSGSAVFNATTGLIEGILVRGEQDFVYTSNGCRLSNRCENSACRGEDVTKISTVMNLIPENGQLPLPF